MSTGQNNFYNTLFSTASHELFPNNTHAAFTTELAQTIDLNSDDEWEVGLCEFTYPPVTVGNVRPVIVVGETIHLIYCNLIQSQFFGDKLIRCLRTIISPTVYSKHVFNNIYYMPVETRRIRHIRIEIKDLTGKPIKFKDSKVPVKLVLHFRRVPRL